jgi:hypothetical protein
MLLAAFVVVTSVFGLLLRENPMLGPIDVGGAVVNLLLLGRRCRRRQRPRPGASGGAYRIEELPDLELEAIAIAGQRLRRGQDL